MSIQVPIMVMNLSTEEERHYFGITPGQAVVAAYAQAERKDWNTWEYQKYYPMRIWGNSTVSCGDWAALL